ncbi:MAG: sugar nucleotide-binding protein [Planctomycetales bacterium]
MVWIVTGAHGQLGTALCRLAPKRMHGLTHAELDITNRQQIQEVLDRLEPEGIINTAAYNFVDRAETEREKAEIINSMGPKILAHECHNRNLPLVHLSTDYVFSGGVNKADEFSEACPLSEKDPPILKGVYATSKFLGEGMVEISKASHFVIRTCGVYGRARTAGKELRRNDAAAG